jgi:DUF2075 family protein
MRAWVAASLADFRARDPADIAARLAWEAGQRHAGDQREQQAAWADGMTLLRTALAHASGDWWLALEYDLLRLGKRIDAVLLTDRAILVLELKLDAERFDAAGLAQVEDYALDLHDFHAGSRAHPIVPVLVAEHAPTPAFDPPLILHKVTPVLRANAASLGALVAWVQQAIPAPHAPLDPAAWLAAPYRPVPTIIEAASTLFARNSVGDIAAARADTANLTRTTEAILRAIESARADNARTVVFVTGIPGAGKTLCGMNVVFGAARHEGAAFLTGNAPLVAVLREALARNAAVALPLRDARRRTAAALQNVHRFLEDNAVDAARVPPERIIVFDEAQRAWDEAKARRGTQNKRSRLTLSEPAHCLEIMGRHDGWAVVVALVRNGQEINDGEAGLAEWGRAVAARDDWRAVAAPRALSAPDPAQRLADGPRPWLAIDDALDLVLPIRAVRDGSAAAWVDAVLAGDAPHAARIAADSGESFGIHLTRDLAAMRAALRDRARGLRRAGLVASSGAKRLRADGLGAQLIGADDTVRWFLERWPDVRASDALEVPATEYSCQGLELDLVGLAWGGDLVRGARGWQVRSFAGARWLDIGNPAQRAFVLNTYRVLLTRARYDTVIWVPPGDDADPTRTRAEMDAIADFLRACGARPLGPVVAASSEPVPL